MSKRDIIYNMNDQPVDSGSSRYKEWSHMTEDIAHEDAFRISLFISTLKESAFDYYVMLLEGSINYGLKWSEKEFCTDSMKITLSPTPSVFNKTNQATRHAGPPLGMKGQQCQSSKNEVAHSYPPLIHLTDALAIVVGLNVVREMCLRMPLLMNEDLLQDMVLYKKSHEKAVSIIAHSLITLLREICSSFLVKKDRGHPIDSKARPKAFGEVSVANDVPGVELLKQDNDNPLHSNYEVAYKEDEYSIENDGESDNEFFLESGESSGIDGLEDDACKNDKLNEKIEVQAICIDAQDEDANDGKDPSNRKKRKLGNFVECLNAVDASLCSLKRLVVIKAAEFSTDEADGIVSNEDFQHIKELMHGFCKDYLVHANVLDQAFKFKENKEAKKALSQHGLLRKDEGYKAATYEIPSSEQLSAKRLNPVKLETGGLSNRQKQHSKAMPLATKRARAARSHQEKKKWQRQGGK
ncbi:hypothetical protein HPP92_027088 [Vanilla planifolia]|uniref:Protein SDA1 n=1 Tax=Vanilla planifolia TaxID=51239 RepID=A0A835PGT0_VANPL|nr:hypothetical protein HPP92_027088 [Vanilla planifolia]